MSDEKCLVVFSGGQDSTLCLLMAMKAYKEVYAISFYYQQTHHAAELRCAENICKKYDIPHTLVHIPMFKQITESELISTGDVNKPHSLNESLPASWVPNRNMLFLTLAHSYAQKLKIQNLWIGVSEEDYSGYPDCRAVFIELAEETLNVGSEAAIKIHAPLVHVSKEHEWQMALELGQLETMRTMTHTCYIGNHTKLHDWGFGCGECPSCKLRKKSFEQFIESCRKDIVETIANEYQSSVPENVTNKEILSIISTLPGLSAELIKKYNADFLANIILK